MSRLSKKHFWEWFKRHHHEYFSMEKKSKKEIEYWANEMSTHLRAYARFLDFSIMSKIDGQQATLTLTVNGKAEYFKKAETFVAMAPKIPGWTFTALEDPRPIDFALDREIRKSGIDPRELSFSFTSDEMDSPWMMVYHPLLTSANSTSIYDLAHGAVYNLLGERSFATDIAGIEVMNLSHAADDDIKPLEELPEWIGMRKSGVGVDENGNLLGMGS